MRISRLISALVLTLASGVLPAADETNLSPLRRIKDDAVRVARESLGARDFAPEVAIERFRASVLSDEETDAELDSENRVKSLARKSGGVIGSRLAARRGELRTLRRASLDELSVMRARLRAQGATEAVASFDEVSDRVADRFDRLDALFVKLEGAASAPERRAARIALIDALKALRPPNETPIAPPPSTLRGVKPVGPPDTSNPSSMLPQYVRNGPSATHIGQELSGSAFIKVAQPAAVATDALTDCSAVAADLQEDISGVSAGNVSLSPEIRALAESLGYSPARILRWMHQNVAFEPYWGALKGAETVLHTRRGNSTDQASLLISLLRASNVPARYVKGVVKLLDPVPTDTAEGRAQRWLGTKTYVGSRTYLGYGQIGSDVEPVGAGTRGILFDHVWVQACLPSSGYRGYALEQTGYRWFPLDPSVKDSGYEERISVDVPLTDATFYNSLLAERTDKLPQEIVADLTEDQVRSVKPGSALEDVLPKSRPRVTKYDVLPITLPYEVAYFLNWSGSTSPETAVLPDQHQMKFDVRLIKSSNSTWLSATFTFPRDLKRRITVGYRPTAATAEAWNTWTGDTGALPVGAVRVVPQIRVDGATLVEAAEANSEPLAHSHSLVMKIRQADRSIGQCVSDSGGPGFDSDKTCINKAVYQSVKAGAYFALGVNGSQHSHHYFDNILDRLSSSVNAAPVAPTPANSSGYEATVGDFLHLVLQSYIKQSNDAEQFIAGTRGHRAMSLYDLGLTTSTLQTRYFFDVPVAVTPGGTLIDILGGLYGYANESASEPESTGDLQARRDLARLTIYTHSALEHHVWQEAMRTDAVSTVRGLQFASETGIPLRRFDRNNISQYLSLMDSSMASYQSAIAAEVAGADGGGHGVVTVPAAKIAYPDPVDPLKKWRGAVYMSENGVTDEYSAVIAGSIVAGGGYSLVNQNPLNVVFNQPSAAPSTVTSEGGAGLLETLTAGVKGVNQFVVTVGDPVNALTGNYIHSEVDFTIRARGGLPVVFERWYNAQTMEDGPLGFGWTHSFNHQLRFYGVEGGLAKIGWINGSGGEQFYSTASHTSGNVPAGTPLTPLPGNFAKLSRMSDGSGRFRITETGGLSYVFQAPSGMPSTLQTQAGAPRVRLLSVADRYGNTLTLHYAGSQLSSVSDSLGRTVLTFTWSGNRITQITDLANRTVVFGYEDGQGNLTRVQNPKGEVSTYSYYTLADGPKLNHALRRHTKPRGNGIEFEYYASGQVFRHTNFDVGGGLIPDSALTFHYNPFRRETWTVDSRGAETRFQFDERGNTVSQSIGNGGQYLYSYAHAANPHLRTSSVDPAGRQTSYTYTVEGYLQTVTHPSGAVSEMHDYTSFGEARRIKDARGNWTLRHFDANGSLTDEVRLRAGVVPATGSSPSETDVLAWTKFQSDQSGNVTGTKRLRSFSGASLGDFASGSGPVVTAAYDSNRFNRQALTRVGNRNGQQVTETTPTFGYDSLGRLTSGIDGRWYSVSFDYDPLDRVQKTLDGLGQPREFTFDPNGNLMALELVAGSNRFDSMSAVFDGQDRIVRRLDNAGNRTAWAYDGVGNVLEVQGPDGYRIGFAYDLANRPYAAFDEQGRMVVTSRDVLGRPLAVTDPAAATTEYDYHGDAQDGRLARIRMPAMVGQANGRAVEFDYDAGGIPTQTRRISAGGAARASMSFTDAVGRVVRTLSEPDDQGLRLQTCYRFDGLSNLTEVWAGPTADTLSAQCNFAETTLKLQQSSTWDDFGNELSRTDALGRTWLFRYDYYGNLESSQTPEQAQVGTRTTYAYDSSLRGMLRLRTVPGGGAGGQSVTWTRNALGQVTRAETKDGSGAVVVAYDYSFDVAHRLSSVSDSRTSKAIVYGWTPGGRLSSIALGSEPDSPLWRFQYDGTGRLTGVIAPNGQAVALSLDAAGRLTEKTWPDGARSTYAWHPEGSLAAISHAAGNRVLFVQSYGFDDWGNRNSSSEIHDQSLVLRSYTYDARDRLTAETTNGLTLSYGFDVFGNRTSRTEGGIATHYLFDAAHQLKEIQGGSSGRLVYDLNGNLRKYCSGNASGTDTDCGGTDVLALAWDGLNQLIQATRSGNSETYAYDDSGRRIRKTAGSNSVQYQYDGPDILAEYGNLAGTPTALYAHGAGMDEPLMRLTGAVGSPQAQVAYYLQDGVGTVVGMARPQDEWNLIREGGALLTATGSFYPEVYPVSYLRDGVTQPSGSEGWVGVTNQGAAVIAAFDSARPVNRVDVIAVPGFVPSAFVVESRVGSGSWVAVATGLASDFAEWKAGEDGLRAIKRFSPTMSTELRIRFTASTSTEPPDAVWLSELQVWSQNTAAQRFDAWGRLEHAIGLVPTYGYTGREPDATGLIHYRARYYHPELGRFVSRDPLGFAAGINPYAYADGNPVLFNDPDGLMANLAWNTSTDYLSRNGTRILDGTQTVLDVAGLVPGFGELADGANALIYLGRGDSTNAALSGAAMIPFVGWGATTAKVVGKADNAVDAAKGAAAAIPKVTDPKLGNIVSDLYKGARGPNPIGTGSTADAIRNEAATGLATGGRFHSQKGAEYIRALENWQAKNPNASHYDRMVAESLKNDLRNALGK